jgi:FixJ family two-component response regulator
MSAARPIVFVVDDDVSVRNALGLLIESAGWQPEAFASGREFLSQTPPVVPSCLLLDLRLPDLHGLDVQRLAADRACTPIIFITGHADVRTTVHAMKAGAMEFLTKPIRGNLLLEAIRNAIERSRVLLEQATDMQRLRDCHASLSRREQEVMALIVSGRLNKQVGGELGISEITVKAHRGRMMRKMQARSLAELVVMAARLSLTPPWLGRIAVDSPRSAAATLPPFADAQYLQARH